MNWLWIFFIFQMLLNLLYFKWFLDVSKAFQILNSNQRYFGRKIRGLRNG